MNKKALPVIIVVILLMLISGWYLMKGNKNPSDDKTVKTENQQTESSTNLKDLLTKGVAQTCNYSSDGGSGKVYVAGGAMRGDFETKADTKMMKSHMIVKDNTSYVWTDDQKTGFKMSFDASIQNQAADLTANYDYKCSTWVVDSSQFTPPADVTFSSFDIPTTQNGGAGSSQCSYCNALSGDDKTQCLTALKCN